MSDLESAEVESQPLNVKCRKSETTTTKKSYRTKRNRAIKVYFYLWASVRKDFAGKTISFLE